MNDKLTIPLQVQVPKMNVLLVLKMYVLQMLFPKIQMNVLPILQIQMNVQQELLRKMSVRLVLHLTMFAILELPVLMLQNSFQIPIDLI